MLQELDTRVATVPPCSAMTSLACARLMVANRPVMTIVLPDKDRCPQADSLFSDG